MLILPHPPTHLTWNRYSLFGVRRKPHTFIILRTLQFEQHRHHLDTRAQPPAAAMWTKPKKQPPAVPLEGKGPPACLHALC